MSAKTPASERLPAYCQHKGRGLAYVTLNGREVYLGPWNTKASKEKYRAVIRDWLARDRQPAEGEQPPADAQPDPTLVEDVIDAFWQHAEKHYRRADGTPTQELRNFRDVLRILRRLYGELHAARFTPLKLKAVREEMIRLGWCRTNINRAVNRVRHVFKWAAGEELVPPSVHHGLLAVAGLAAGRSEANESTPVGPVPAAAVDATLPLLPTPLAALVKLQRLTGMRPGEVCSMRGLDLTTPTGPELWEYRPAQHKTAHRGHERVIVLGRQARELVETFLKPDPQAYLFSPADAEAERRAKMSEAREAGGSPLSCGNKPGSNRRRRPLKRPGSRYSVEAYAKAIAAACDKAFPLPDRLARQRVPARGRKAKATRWESVAEWKARLGKQWAEVEAWRDAHRWHPNQLRHTFATEARKRYGLEVAQVLLGHRTLTVTQVYAEKNVEAARRVMREVG